MTDLEVIEILKKDYHWTAKQLDIVREMLIRDVISIMRKSTTNKKTCTS